MELLIPLFGWPGAIGSFCVMCLAWLVRSHRLFLAGAFLSAPFLLYVSGYPAVGGFGILALVSNLAGAMLLKYRRSWLAGLLLLPFAALGTFVASLVAG